jgi:hypothetical protein
VAAVAKAAAQLRQMAALGHANPIHLGDVLARTPSTVDSSSSQAQLSIGVPRSSPQCHAAGGK